MRRQVILSPGAEQEIASALEWYDQQRSVLRFRFAAELRRVLRHVAQNPYMFPLDEDGVRRALMRRFPYAIFFGWMSKPSS